MQEFLAKQDFPPMKNTRILQAARGEIPDKLPIWIMRQAGRYLPEFQALRKEHSFFKICQTPKLACEATLLPIRRYDLDAAIIFSDILVIPQALGMEVLMVPEKGPVFTSPLTLETYNTLTWENAVNRLSYVGDAIRLTRHQLEGRVPLLGFSAAPWTLMVYMIEGGSPKAAMHARKWLYAEEATTIDFLQKLADVIVDYLVMQVKSGAQMLQLFESCAEFLNVEMYEKLMAPMLKKIREGVRDKLLQENVEPVPMVFFGKGGSHLVDIPIKAGFDVISIDWITDPRSIRSRHSNVTLQGNLDPCAMYCKKEELVEHIKKMYEKFGFKNYIVNLGHGIHLDTPTESVATFVETVHSFM